MTWLLSWHKGWADGYGYKRSVQNICYHQAGVSIYLRLVTKCLGFWTKVISFSEIYSYGFKEPIVAFSSMIDHNSISVRASGSVQIKHLSIGLKRWGEPRRGSPPKQRRFCSRIGLVFLNNNQSSNKPPCGHFGATGGVRLEWTALRWVPVWWSREKYYNFLVWTPISDWALSPFWFKM